MIIVPNTAWGLITARGGSKSIPLKNLVEVRGRPMIAYAIAAAKRSKLNRLVCSTDHDGIAAVSAGLGCEIALRPDELSGDEVNTIDVLLDLVQSWVAGAREMPEVLVLLQPTSLFVQAGEIDAVIDALLSDPSAKSSQTVVRVPHQFHAHNQRRMSVDGRDIGFVYPAERAKGHNKQTKPVFYAYGNLIATRTRVLLEERTIFARPSRPVVIPINNAFDLDGPDDLPIAEMMIARKLVEIDA